MEIRFKKKSSLNFVPMPQQVAKQGSDTLQTIATKQNDTKQQTATVKQNDAKLQPSPVKQSGPKPQMSAAKQKDPKPQMLAAKQHDTKPQTPATKQVTAPLPVSTKRSKKPRLKVSGASTMSKAQRETRDQSMGQARKGLIFIGMATITYALYLVFSGQMGEFLTAMAGVRRRWVVAAMLAYVVYFFWGVLAYLLAVISDRRSTVGIRDLMSVEASGIFFSNLTPNGAGGAPAQIYRLTRAGLSAGGAGAVQYTRFIMYEAGEGIFAALMLLFRWEWLTTTYGNVTFIGMILFGFKVVEVGGLLLVCLRPGFVRRAGSWIIRFASRHGWMKRTDHWIDVVTVQVGEFSSGFRQAAGNLRNMLMTLVVTLLQLACLYSLPWFVARAFGHQADLITCMACGSMLELLTSAVPLPGGVGGAEGGFAVLFAPIFGARVAAAFVVWRMVEYLLPILAAAPLLGLQSSHIASLAARWDRLRYRLAQDYSQLRAGKGFSRQEHVKVDLRKAHSRVKQRKRIS